MKYSNDTPHWQEAIQNYGNGDACSEEQDHGSLLSEYDHLRITTQIDFVPPVPVVKIKDAVISTAGNITTFSGLPKSGKTAVINVLIAGAVSKDGNYDGFEGIQVEPNPDSLAVICFDTEQSKQKQQKNLQIILKRLGISECPPNLLCYNLKEVPLGIYKKVVREICEAAKEKFGGIHMIVIDGGADFVLDVNDPSSSTKLVRFFERLAVKHDTCVILIIHLNPGSAKERGHLGSQLQRKGESVIAIQQDGDKSYLMPKFLREAGRDDVPAIQFSFDKSKGYHTSAGVRSAEELKQKTDMLSALARGVFGDGSAYPYSDAIVMIMQHSGKKERTAKELFKELRALKLIQKDENGDWCLFTAHSSEVQETGDETELDAG
ncbi:MAG: hypothetical protein EOO10_18635 [Chitinophagaceae bacterium]|nr:MAG: hypothetical protein EOO10_18635 [Chitinophagaceae bacterium]